MQLGINLLPFRQLTYVIGVFTWLATSASTAIPQDQFGKSIYTKVGNQVNAPIRYPVKNVAKPLKCTINLAKPLGKVSEGIFGTNLEWFNNAGGLSSPDHTLRDKLTELAKVQGVSVMRFPGGTLSDYYDWRDGVGLVNQRPKRPHHTDAGASENNFGSPEFFKLLKRSGSEGLITVNVGTGTPEMAANWVAYANKKLHPMRAKDGFASPVGIRYWEIGNELYYDGVRKGEKNIGLNPTQYADKYLAFSRAIKKIDPTVKTIAIGVVKSHIGPTSPYVNNWTETLLKKAGQEIDMIAVHNGYFPMLYHERQPSVRDIYPSFLAAPETVDQSLVDLTRLIKQYESGRRITIGITEWGAFFSLPNVDNYWVDHVKTMGSGIYVARMLQIMMSHPRLELANYFKFTDRSFMGWVNYQGKPKVPFWVFALYANHHGDQHLSATINSPTYDAPMMGKMASQKGVAEVTVHASEDRSKGKVYVNVVNRSLSTRYPIKLNFLNGKVSEKARQLKIEAQEITAHNGRDMPPEWPYKAEYEPYTTAPIDSIKIQESVWRDKQVLEIAPFSVITLVFDKQ